MEASKSIVTIYKLIEDLTDPIRAKNSVSDALFNIISDLQAEGIPITEEIITQRLARYAQDYQQASKSNVA